MNTEFAFFGVCVFFAVIGSLAWIYDWIRAGWRAYQRRKVLPPPSPSCNRGSRA